MYQFFPPVLFPQEERTLADFPSNQNAHLDIGTQSADPLARFWLGCFADVVDEKESKGYFHEFVPDDSIKGRFVPTPTNVGRSGKTDYEFPWLEPALHVRSNKDGGWEDVWLRLTCKYTKWNTSRGLEDTDHPVKFSADEAGRRKTRMTKKNTNSAEPKMFDRYCFIEQHVKNIHYCIELACTTQATAKGERALLLSSFGIEK